MTMFGSTLFAINNGSQASSKVAIFICIQQEKKRKITPLGVIVGASRPSGSPSYMHSLEPVMATPEALYNILPASLWHRAPNRMNQFSFLTGNLLTCIT